MKGYIIFQTSSRGYRIKKTRRPPLCPLPHAFASCCTGLFIIPQTYSTVFAPSPMLFLGCGGDYAAFVSSASCSFKTLVLCHLLCNVCVLHIESVFRESWSVIRMPKQGRRLKEPLMTILDLCAALSLNTV